MPGAVADGLTVSMSCKRAEEREGQILYTYMRTVANNFWGKDDAGVHPLLERMQNAKVTCDELKSFYNCQPQYDGPTKPRG